jgi:hypothetical protein
MVKNCGAGKVKLQIPIFHCDIYTDVEAASVLIIFFRSHFKMLCVNRFDVKAYDNSTCSRANGLYPILIVLAGAHFPGRTANCNNSIFQDITSLQSDMIPRISSVTLL